MAEKNDFINGKHLSGDFISDYVRYADVLEAPPEAHEAVAIQLLASVLNRNVHIELGGLKIPLDLWVLLLSASGYGRNTIVGFARPVLEEAGLNDILRDTTWGSKQQCIRILHNIPTDYLLGQNCPMF